MSEIVVPPPSPPAPKPEFDQILSGHVKIRKICSSEHHEYRIKFSKKHISDVLLYQVWSPTSAALNSSRKVIEVNAKNWVKLAFPKNVPSPAVPFTPTTVMEHGNKKYVFVINDAKVNKHGHVIFRVSSEYIDPNSTNKVIKKLKKIPTTKKGETFHARFDIDYSYPGAGQGCEQCWENHPECWYKSGNAYHACEGPRCNGCFWS
jgi:hypothetical protein